MKINWKVRIANKDFWIALIPALILLVQAVAMLLGFKLDLSTLEGKLLAVIDAVFAVLTILGIVNDPTTDGLLKDSNRAQGYEKPWKDEEPVEE